MAAAVGILPFSGTYHLLFATCFCVSERRYFVFENVFVPAIQVEEKTSLTALGVASLYQLRETCAHVRELIPIFLTFFASRMQIVRCFSFRRVIPSPWCLPPLPASRDLTRLSSGMPGTANLFSGATPLVAAPSSSPSNPTPTRYQPNPIFAQKACSRFLPVIASPQPSFST